MTFFDRAFEKLIGHEGGYVNDPDDPGGETKYGISKRSYPKVDIRSLTLADAKAIYKRDYWDAVRADDLPPVAAYLAFDAAVNSGVASSARWLQGAAGVFQDGKIGPLTLAAVRAKAGTDLYADMLQMRLALMMAQSTWTKYGKGWARRLFRLPFEAQALAA